MNSEACGQTHDVLCGFRAGRLLSVTEFIGKNLPHTYKFVFLWYKLHREVFTLLHFCVWFGKVQCANTSEPEWTHFWFIYQCFGGVVHVKTHTKNS